MVFTKIGKFGELIETDDLAFVIKSDSSQSIKGEDISFYGFDFNTVASLKNSIINSMEFNVVDRASQQSSK